MRKLTKAATNVANAELYAYECRTTSSVSSCGRNHGSVTSIQRDCTGKTYPRYNGYVTCGHTTCYTRMREGAVYTAASQGYKYVELFINGIPYGMWATGK